MRLSKISLAVAAGTLIQLFLSAPTAAAGDCCRVADGAVINRDGPFISRASAARMHVGSFRADTRQARALMLLHELGHLLRGADGRWLLPNDGNDGVLSDLNTKTVESHCEEQLLAIK